MLFKNSLYICARKHNHPIMNLKNYPPKDTRLINDNEGKFPDELLALGLSQRGYRRLLEDSIEIEQSNSTMLQPLKVEAINLKAIALPAAQLPRRIRLYNKKSGRAVLMGYKAATMLAEKYPNEFELVA